MARYEFLNIFNVATVRLISNENWIITYPSFYTFIMDAVRGLDKDVLVKLIYLLLNSVKFISYSDRT
jgi:hypothetical protein